MALPSILLIDDNQQRAQQVATILQFLEYSVSLLHSRCDISAYAPDSALLLLIGHGLPKQASYLKSIIDQAPNTPIALLVDPGTCSQVASPLQKLVSYCQEWPTTYSALQSLLSEVKQRYSAVINTSLNTTPKGLAGSSVAMVRTRALIAQVAHSEATVLILGESGTGKEVVAQTLHRLSARREKPFVPINCGAIPAELLESELFGHEKGAFTGALNTRQGRFELAEGGTLFLDEIGDMPMNMQVKLLRVLQERTFERVGSNKTLACDVRIIAATHRQLEQEIKANRFREDLFYRLNVFPIELPALRTRSEDIPELLNDLSYRITGGKKMLRFSAQALHSLRHYPWPGNVRELANLMERLYIMKPDGFIELEDLPEKFQTSLNDNNTPHTQLNAHTRVNFVPMTKPTATINQLPESGIDLKEYLNDMETDLIRQALNECNGVVAHAAKRLNMRRTTLVEKLRKFDLARH